MKGKNEKVNSMPYLAPGVYIDAPDELPFEAEECYFLNFQITSALAALEYLLARQYEETMPFDSKCEYYHFFTDHLLYSWGQITNRFTISAKDKGITRERKERCIGNFFFNEDQYSILNDKRPRNTVEHLDEHNQRIIMDHNGVGGFNLIDSDMDEELSTLLRNNRDTHPYTLDLLSNQLYIQRNGDPLTIDLLVLKDELLKLRNSVRTYKWLMI